MGVKDCQHVTIFLPTEAPTFARHFEPPLITEPWLHTPEIGDLHDPWAFYLQGNFNIDIFKNVEKKLHH